MSKPAQNAPSLILTLIDGISTEYPLVNLTETLASAHAVTRDDRRGVTRSTVGAGLPAIAVGQALNGQL